VQHIPEKGKQKKKKNESNDDVLPLRFCHFSNNSNGWRHLPSCGVELVSHDGGSNAAATGHDLKVTVGVLCDRIVGVWMKLELWFQQLDGTRQHHGEQKCEENRRATHHQQRDKYANLFEVGSFVCKGFNQRSNSARFLERYRLMDEIL
jgi:hypothetical protein